MKGSIAPNRQGHRGTVVARTVGTVAISCNENFKYAELLHSLPRISEETKLDLDKPYTIQELIMVIRSSELNKAPGPD